jgi:hypothetical protein
VYKLEELGFTISRYHVKQMLQLRGYKKRKLVKMNDLSHVSQRNEQFEKINIYRKQFTDMNFPILSIDTKKKEMTDNFHRDGSCYSQAMR